MAEHAVPEPEKPIGARIDRWRDYQRKKTDVSPEALDRKEMQLREHMAALSQAGLSPEEAFLLALKRMHDLDFMTREFAPEPRDPAWKQFLVAPFQSDEPQPLVRQDALIALGLAVLAALLIKLPELFGVTMADNEGFYARNLSFFVLPLLAGYFAWKRSIPPRQQLWAALAFVLAIAVANIYPFVPGGSTEGLAALHLPIALWLIVGIAYAGRRWAETAGRMDFIRYSGELFIYLVLIGLGGGVLSGFTAMIFNSIGIDIEPYFERWVLPCGMMGGVVVAAWLAEAKQHAIENMAPVLTRLFTPLFAAMLILFLVTLLWTGRGIDIEREVLIAFDLLLVVVLGLLVYSLSARDPRAAPGPFDVMQVVLLISALLANAVALWAIVSRISDFGFSPNRVAALGENLILLVNLGGAALLYIRFLGGKSSFSELEEWQTSYLPVFFFWAAIVIIVFPPLFGFA